MIILFVLLATLSLWGVRIRVYNVDYLSISQTTAIKGIFAVVILFSHILGYIQLSNEWYDVAYKTILSYIGQLMVALYLFYSGYGIFESLKHKKDYEKSFVKKRIIKTLIHFNIAVLLYLVLSVIIGKYYPTYYYLTCWIGWNSIGNSNWFVFDILILYLGVYLGMRLTRNVDKYRMFCLASFILIYSIVLIAILYITGKGFYWYDTILVFSLGAFFSMCSEKISLFFKNTKSYARIGLVLFLLFCFVLWYRYFRIDDIGICACLFSLLVVACCTMVKIDNRVLHWLGVCCFEIYILQRFPMNILQAIGVNDNPYVFVAIVIPSVILLSWLFNMLLKRIDSIIIK